MIDRNTLKNFNLENSKDVLSLPVGVLRLSPIFNIVGVECILLNHEYEQKYIKRTPLGHVSANLDVESLDLELLSHGRASLGCLLPG